MCFHKHVKGRVRFVSVPSVCFLHPLFHSSSVASVLSEPLQFWFHCCELSAFVVFFVVCRWLVANSCPSLCDPVDCSMPDSSVHGISQARILEWVAISFSRGSPTPQGWNLCLLHWQSDSLPLSYQGSLCGFLVTHSCVTSFDTL